MENKGGEKRIRKGEAKKEGEKKEAKHEEEGRD